MFECALQLLSSSGAGGLVTLHPKKHRALGLAYDGFDVRRGTPSHGTAEINERPRGMGRRRRPLRATPRNVVE